MARKIIVAGNWKLNHNLAASTSLARVLLQTAPQDEKIEIVVCPVFTALADVCRVLENSHLKVGAQDCYWEESGAFTGEVSPSLIKDVGCHYVIIGHSERRGLFGEKDAAVLLKTKAAMKQGLIPIVCAGETLNERKTGKTQEVVTHQVNSILDAVEPALLPRVVIAYEPVWAIGTGVNATTEQAQEVHAMIRKLLAIKGGPAAAAETRILYGGSMKPENAAELLACPDVDGGLIGGASLKAESFIGIIKAAMGVKRT